MGEGSNQRTKPLLGTGIQTNITGENAVEQLVLKNLDNTFRGGENPDSRGFETNPR